jgi:hypothetical protein
MSPLYVCCAVQLYTQVEAYTAAIGKLQEMGFKVNIEDSELIYRGTAGEGLGYRPSCSAAAAAVQQAHSPCKALGQSLSDTESYAAHSVLHSVFSVVSYCLCDACTL